MPVRQISKSFLQGQIAQGASQSALCALTGLSMTKLRALLETHGIVMQGGGHRRLPPVTDLIERIEAGEHPKSIAAEFSVSVPAVYRAVARSGTTVTNIREGKHLQRGRMGLPAGTLRLMRKHQIGVGK